MEIKAMIKEHYSSAENIKELKGGLDSQTYSFDAHDDRYIFQAGTRKESYMKEMFIHQNYHHILPVREVLKAGKTEKTAYSISKFIEGNPLFDLNNQELLATVPSVLEILETLESVEVPDTEGYGYFDHRGHASYPTWLAFINAVYNDPHYNWSCLENRGLESKVAKQAIRELKSHIGSVSLTQKYIVHGDLGSYNLLAKKDQITGLIDWNLSLFGDHLYDKANILFWDEDQLQPLIQQITHKYITSSVSKEKFYCYMLRIGLEEIYNTIILNVTGYDIKWVVNRLQKIMDTFL